MQVVIAEEQHGQRLDVFLATEFPDHSRSYWAKACTKGYVTLNDKPGLPKAKARTGDKVIIQIPELDIQPIDIPIIFEDDNVVVINKPLGMLSHSKGAYNPEFTVADFFKTKVTDDESNRPGIVHRLDRGTSGVMLGAKNKDTKKHLQKEFSNRNVKKWYTAIVEGELKDEEAKIEVPIERNPKHPSTFRPGNNGKSAETNFTVLERKKGKTIVELRPLTGRTHQLRVHMSFMGHPIAGDEVYGAKHAERVYLHASKLEITLPGGKRSIFEAPLPKDFKL